MNEQKQIPPPELFDPGFLPTNQRVICQPVSKGMDVTKAGIHIVRNPMFGKSNREKEKSTTKWINDYLFIVALPANIEELMPLPSVKDLKTKKVTDYKTEIGDVAVISDDFEPIEKPIGETTFLLIHTIDILGIIKTPKGQIVIK